MKAIIEMPMNTRYKYELKNDELFIDRVQSIPVPYNYGYIPNTLAPDGDPLDVFVISDEPIPARTNVEIYPLGVFICEDNGVRDDKLVAVIRGESIPKTGESHLIEFYLNNYKDNFNVLKYETIDLYQQILVGQTLP